MDFISVVVLTFLATPCSGSCAVSRDALNVKLGLGIPGWLEPAQTKHVIIYLNRLLVIINFVVRYPQSYFSLFIHILYVVV